MRHDFQLYGASYLIHAVATGLPAAFSFGQGPDKTWLNNVQCTGDEERLIDCQSVAVGDYICFPHWHSAVRCESKFNSKEGNYIILLVSYTDATLLPFGIDMGDNSTSAGNLTSLGPFHLETPVVYYLQKEYQFYVSIIS